MLRAYSPAPPGAPAVLPFGALEQHGPHLPLSTDTIMATWLAEQVADAVHGWLLPAVPLGDTAANESFPGTVSLSFDTVRSIVIDVGRGLRRSGFPCLIVVNGDFGNQAPLRVAARDLARKDNWPVLVIDYPGLDEVAAQVCETPPAGPGSTTPTKSRPRLSSPCVPTWCTSTGPWRATRRCP